VNQAATGAMQEFGAPGAPSTGKPRAGLILLYAEGFERLPAAWLLQKGRNVLGREAPADLVVPVEAVSRVHAEVVWERGYVLRDLGSTNGTLVDGCRVREARLEHGQEVRVGDAILKFVAEGAEAMGGYRLDGTMIGAARRRAREVEDLVGGFQMDRIAAEIERIAKSPLSVVLLGESGTGKEVVARAVHRASGRRGQFRAVNCAAIPQNLLESELFGYKKGAFSGADRDKPGLMRAADGGTLLLDEIGDMPLEAQAKLLRVLQSKEVYPVGSTSPEPVDVRVVCATHRDLIRLQVEGRFRQDLFARLNEYQLSLPPLRDRKEDVYVLLRTFLTRHGRAELRPSFRFMTALLHYDWPYNVRELEACVKRAVALADAPVVDAPLLPEPIRDAMADYGRAPAPPGPQPVHPSDAPIAPAPPTEAALREMLLRHQGNVAAVGRELGKARMQIHRWMQKYGIDIDDYRA
jgi:sigma-54 dependent transcriptional regulator, acetoin dehydrogenase operon transcriptional activator AcoR